MDNFLKNLWHWKCNIPEIETNQKKINIDDLFQSEWSPIFENLCRNRLVMGALRYGKLNGPGKPDYDRTESIEKRLILYRKTGNDEFLIDIANLCMLEFEEGKHPMKHFNSIDGGEHVKEKI